MGELITIPFYPGGKKTPAPNHAFIGRKEEGADL